MLDLYVFFYLNFKIIIKRSGLIGHSLSIVVRNSSDSLVTALNWFGALIWFKSEWWAATNWCYTVSATCRQTIQVCFFFPRTVKWVRRKRKEKIKGKLEKQIWCPECWKWYFRVPNFKIFWGICPTTPCSYSRLFFPTQLPTSHFIESPA